VGFIYGYFWTAATAVYYLLRRDVDATEMDEVYLDADASEPAAALPPLATDAAGAPVAGQEAPQPAPAAKAGADQRTPRRTTRMAEAKDHQRPPRDDAFRSLSTGFRDGRCMSQPRPELTDQLFRERVARARAMPLDEKFLAGARLFDRSCRIIMDGIRAQFPEADEAEVRRIRDERLRILRRLEAGAVTNDWDYVHQWRQRHGTRAILDTIRGRMPPL